MSLYYPPGYQLSVYYSVTIGCGFKLRSG